jgi:hypothetical protein
VRSAVSPHTPDTEAWQTAAVKKAIYTPPPPDGTDTQLLHLSAFHKKGVGVGQVKVRVGDPACGGCVGVSAGLCF